jgi:lysophospholipase L1-like esterase
MTRYVGQLMCSFALLICICPSSALAQDKSQVAKTAFDLPESDEGLPGAGPVRRYDWFKKLWSERRSKWAEQVEQDQGAIVFLGDSITQGWRELDKNFAPAKIANRGISGDTTRGMLIRLKDDVLSLKPSAVVMLMGTNDLEENAEPETIAANVKLIVGELKKHNEKMPIVLCQVFPSSETKKRPADKIKKLNELCAAAVAFDSQITVLETWTLFANADGNAKLEEFPDLLHPNEVGYEKWGKALRPILATLGLIETEADNFRPEAGFVSLFNGKDLSGWCLLPTTPDQIKQRERWKNSDKGAPPWPIITERLELAGKTSTPDGRYVARNGRLIVTTPPEGRRIQQLWTSAQFSQDFTLKLEFRATPNADSGVFLRQPQLQCRDYPLAGPYKDLKHYRNGDWNELIVVAKGASAYCTCNGEVIEGAFKLPPTGPIGLEGDRGQLEYRRIRIRHGDNLLSPVNDADAWKFETAQGGAGTMKVVEDTIVFETTAVTGTNWHVQAYQGKLELENGAEYTLRFKMKSPTSSPVTVLGIINQEDWHEYGLNEMIETHPEFKEYEITFRPHDVVPANNRISFELGDSKGIVILKDLVLLKKN